MYLIPVIVIIYSERLGYAAAVSLSNNPTMKFDGDPLDFVKFWSLMTNNYEQAISYSPTLYSIQQKHLVGNATSLIDLCNYLDNKIRYKEAINLLTEMYGN